MRRHVGTVGVVDCGGGDASVQCENVENVVSQAWTVSVVVGVCSGSCPCPCPCILHIRSLLSYMYIYSLNSKLEVCT